MSNATATKARSAHLAVARSSQEYATGSQCLCNAHIDDMRASGWEPGQLLRVFTESGRSTIARLSEPRTDAEAKGSIHLDRFMRQALKARLGENVTVQPVDEVPLKKIVLLPAIDVFSAHNLDRHVLGTLVENRTPATAGSVIYIKFLDSIAGTTYKVISVEGDYGVVTPETKLEFEITENLHTDAVSEVTFDDVGGMRRQLDLMRELLQLPLQAPEVYRQLGINPPRGVVLHGPPGVGKTHLARALANEVKAKFYYISGPDVVGTMYGETESNLRRVFSEATHHAPAVILIDELDAIAPRRGESGALSDTRMVTQLLALMDGMTRVDGLIVVGTTNRLDAIDMAMRRPGRFDREIYVGPPDAAGRLEVLEIHSREMPLTEAAIDYMPEVARRSPGFVGADLMEVCREAGLTALRRKTGGIWKEGAVSPADLMVDKEDFESALQRIQPSAIREVLVTVPDVTWDDIGGLDDVKARLRNTVQFALMRRDELAAMKLSPPSGVLLHGPSGTGKTLLAKAVAHEIGVNFIAVDGPEIFTKWLGESEEMIRRIFRVARQLAPAIVFFDQLDAIAPSRGADVGTKTTERVVSQLLTELDGIEAMGGIIIIGATNRMELIDESVLRPGRFGTHIFVPPPSDAERGEIARIQLDGVTLAAGNKMQDLISLVVKSSKGWSGADLKSLFDEAKMAVVMGQRKGLARKDLELVLKLSVSKHKPAAKAGAKKKKPAARR